MMEPIEQALRKARENRAQQQSLQSSGVSSGVRTPAGVAGIIPNYTTPPAVTYSQTRVVQLKPSVLERNRVVANELINPVTDVYRSLRAQVLKGMSKLGKTTLGITSVGHHEGKTVTAINLAMAAAMDANQTILLVDADMRTPSVARCLGIDPGPGLGEFLAGRASIQECLVNPGLQRLSVLPSRDSAKNSAELLSSPQMLQLARELKGRYPDRLIIYDLPPLFTTGDTLGFIHNIETTLLVVKDGAAKPTDIKRAVSLLNERNLLGTVLNAGQ